MGTDDPFELLGVSASASDDELRQAWRRKIQQAHPDVAGVHFTDAAARINAAYHQIETQPDRDAYERARTSQILTCPECGATQLTDSDLLHHSVLHEATVRSVACQICSRQPASDVRFTGVTGFLLARQHWEITARLCKACGKGAFRSAQARLLTTGWWSIFAFIATPFLLLANIGRSSTHRSSLTDPQPRDPVLDRLLVGRPVFTRPGVLVVMTIFVAVLILIGVDSSQSSSASVPRTPRTTVAPGEGVPTTTPRITTTAPAPVVLPWEEGNCVSINNVTSMVDLVPCGFRAAGIITDIVFSEFDCPPGTIGTIDLRDETLISGSYACVSEY